MSQGSLPLLPRSQLSSFRSVGALAAGMSSFLSRRVAVAERLLRLHKEVELECGDISASQVDLLARAPFLGGGGEEDDEVFSTPPLTQVQQQSQGGEGEGEGDGITMCSLPFSQLSIPSSEEEEEKEKQPRKPRICTRKVRGARVTNPNPNPTPTPTPTPNPNPSCTSKVRGAKIRTPPPSPTPSPGPGPGPDNRSSRSSSRPSSSSSSVDPLYRAVMMIPTAPPPGAAENIDILELARSRGIF